MKPKGKAILFIVLFLLPCLIIGALGSNKATGIEKAALPLFAFISEKKPDPEKALHFYENRDIVTRFAEVKLGKALKSPGLLKQGDQVILNLFGDTAGVAIVQRTGVNINNSVFFTATCQKTGGYLVLATTGSRTLGNILMPRQNLFYKIISDPQNTRHYLLEMDACNRDILECNCSKAPSHPENCSIEQSGYFQNYNEPCTEHFKATDDVNTDDVNIDVMAVYTPAAQAWADLHGGGMHNVTAVSMANTQLVLDNSQALINLALVYSSVVDYEETGNSQIDLWRLIASPWYNPFGYSVWGGYGIPGYMDEVHYLRNEYYADLCVLFTHTNDFGGMARQLTNRHGQPKHAFSIVRVQQAAHSYTQAHEMGHNLGCHHHKEQNSWPGPTNWSNWHGNRFSAGWRWQSDDGRYYCSVMSYASGSFFNDGINHTRIPMFSSPDIDYLGTPAGNALDGDNLRTINKTKHIISNYRVPGMAIVSTKHVTDVELFSAVSGGSIIVCNNHPVSQYGLLWDTLPYPKLDHYTGITVEERGSDNFVSRITGLDHSTGYYVVAYAQNDIGTAYGPQRFFQTPIPTLPTVSTIKAQRAGHSFAVAGGVVTNSGNSEVYRRGLVWSTQSNPTIAVHDGITREGTGTGSFESTMNSLIPDTKYFYRAYATNRAGTVYGVQHTLNTPVACIFPNPFSHKLHISFYNNSKEVVFVVLTNLQGQQVLEKQVTKYGDIHKSLSVSHLNNGLYFLSIKGDQYFPDRLLIKADHW